MNQNRSFLPGAAGQGQQEGYRTEPTYFPGAQSSYSTPQTPVYPNTQTVGYAAPRQPQSYPSFNTPDSGMYNVPPQTQPMAFDSPPYQRPSAVSTTEFGGYSTGSLQTPTLQQHISSGPSGGYQTSPADQGQLQSEYHSQMGGIPEVANENYQEPPAMEAAYATYQTALKQIFQNILDGRLQVGARSLLEISEWLLGHVKELGLTVDQVSLHADRIRLWGELNTAWQAIFQKQIDMVNDDTPRNHPNLMPVELINKMANDLIRLCDTIDSHGLVDYQYGVAEEQIMDIVIICADLMEEGS